MKWVYQVRLHHWTRYTVPPTFPQFDLLTAIANLVELEYQEKMNKRIQSRLCSAHLREHPQ